MNDTIQAPSSVSASTDENRSPAPRSRAGVAALSVAGALLLLIGAGAGAGAYGLIHKERPTFDTSLPSTPIAQLQDTDQVEINGKVVEIFGNKFVLEDAGARALVETGRAGEGGKLVAKDELITVQGRFDNGFLHATALQRANGDVDELQPPPPPPHKHGPAIKP